MVAEFICNYEYENDDDDDDDERNINRESRDRILQSRAKYILLLFTEKILSK